MDQKGHLHAVIYTEKHTAITFYLSTLNNCMQYLVCINSEHHNAQKVHHSHHFQLLATTLLDLHRCMVLLKLCNIKPHSGMHKLYGLHSRVCMHGIEFPESEEIITYI